MQLLRLFSDAGGDSHFETGTWDLHAADVTPPSPPGYRVGPSLQASSALVMHHPRNYKDAWHCAPCNVLVTVLRGAVRVQASDGQARILAPGDQLMVEDTTGHGHLMEAVDGEIFELLLVLLSDPTP